MVRVRVGARVRVRGRGGFETHRQPPHPAAPLLSEARGIRLQPLQQQRDAAAPLRKGKPAHILPREARRVDDVRALLVR